MPKDSLKKDGRRPSELLVDLSKPSLALDRTELRQAEKLCVMSADALQERFRAFVRKHQCEPLSFTFSNDPTPLSSTVYDHTDGHDGQARCKRSGGASDEYLIQRVWGRNMHGDVVVAFFPPRIMANKTAACHMAGTRAMMPSPFEMGAKGLNISHGVWDRGIFSAEYRLFCQYHAYELELHCSGMDAGEAALFEKLSWVTGNGCCAHDCHGALGRAYNKEITDKQFKKECFKSLASLRGGFSIMIKHVVEWIGSTLAFEDWEVSATDQGALWRTLGFVPACEQLLVDLELRFDPEGGRLLVASRHQSDRNVIKKVKLAVVRAWCLSSWSESRWLGSGAKARAMTSSLLLGIESLVSYCLTTKRASGYNLGNFAPSADVKSFFASIGIASHVAESALNVYMDDDRSASNLEEIDWEIASEVCFVESISEQVWNTIAKAVGATSAALRDRTIAAAHAQASALRWRLAEHRELPLSLLHGDRRANLGELRLQEERPVELGIAAKIWDLLQINFPVEQILEGLELWAGNSRSTKTTEEGHVQASRIRRYHKQGGGTHDDRAGAAWSVPHPLR